MTDSPGSFAAPADRNPVIALVPAAWHAPVHYRAYTDQLEANGYTISTRRLPSCDSSNPAAESVGRDAEFIRSVLLMPFINAGREVVVIMHSYSGGPGAMAAKGLSIPERRAAGKPGGIIGLIFISAFLAEEGQSLLSASGGAYAPWVIEYDDGQLGVRDAKETLYNDVPEALAKVAIAELRNQSRHSAETPCGPPAWADDAYDNRRAYAHTTLDNAIVPAAQDAMLQQTGVQWTVQNFATSHSPFLSQPKQLTTWTIDVIAGFQALGGVSTS